MRNNWSAAHTRLAGVGPGDIKTGRFPGIGFGGRPFVIFALPRPCLTRDVEWQAHGRTERTSALFGRSICFGIQVVFMVERDQSHIGEQSDQQLRHQLPARRKARNWEGVTPPPKRLTLIISPPLPSPLYQALLTSGPRYLYLSDFLPEPYL